MQNTQSCQQIQYKSFSNDCTITLNMNSQLQPSWGTGEKKNPTTKTPKQTQKADPPGVHLHFSPFPVTKNQQSQTNLRSSYNFSFVVKKKTNYNRC